MAEQDDNSYTSTPAEDIPDWLADNYREKIEDPESNPPTRSSPRSTRTPPPPLPHGLAARPLRTERTSPPTVPRPSRRRPGTPTSPSPS